ncbi:DoxX family protein [Streptomyces sp. TG1A-8]|uniref:DoxX family protein n=1 Tax=Streptomyces sp. TG1A-8 TaxID=3051385 RepID=UPI00265BB445|nr:DoxX family protein [Streptomyces sp. TG1A-8]MDO0924365.1 DoxX family protein [Streptomyces sp. TG1A-8]
MPPNYVALTLALSAVLAGSAVAMLMRARSMVTRLTALGVPESWLPRLAAVEIAGALGLLAGFAYRPLGVAAGAGALLYFVGAVIVHLRSGDTRGSLAPLVLVLVSSGAALLALQTS